MVKKHIHHFNRGLVIGLEILGLAVVAVLVAWLFLVIRLSQGPLNVDFLTRHIEKSLNSQQTGFEMHVGSTVLTWGGASQPFEFEISHVQVNRADTTPVLSVEKIGIQFSRRNLVFGRFVPRVIRIYSPALRVIRGEDGHFVLNMSDAAAAPETTAVEGAVSSQTDFMKSLLAQLGDADRSSLLGGLERISVKGAALLYEDKILQVGWKSRKSDLSFSRVRGGLLIDAIADVEQDQAHSAYVRTSFFHSLKKNRSNGVVYFTSFNPSLLAQQSEQLKYFSGIDLPLKGSISFEMDRDFKVGYGRFVLGSDPGRFNALGFYREPIPVTSLYLQGRFNAATKEAVLDQLHMNLDGPKVGAKASVKREKEGHVIAVSAVLDNMPLDKLKYYWPETLTPDPRAWVTGHLSVGVATKATLDLAMLAPEGNFRHLALQKVGGKIDYNGIKVDYFPPLLPVTKVKGTATYDEKSFNLDVSSGTLGDMQVTGSKIAITDLDIQNEKTHSKIDINVSLKGPLKTALKVLDSEPLKYPKELGIQTAEVEGDTNVDVNFKFPLHKALALPEVKVTAKAKLDNVMLKDMVAGFPLSGGPMDLSVSTGAMIVKGKGVLGEMPVEFNWVKNFSEKADVASKVEAKLSLTAEALKKFGVPQDIRMTGALPADVTYTVTKGQMATLLFKGDITPSAFAVPVVNYQKLAGVPGTLDFVLHFKNGKPSEMTSLSLATEAAFLKGSLQFSGGRDGQLALKKLAFDQVRLGDTDMALTVDGTAAGGYAVKISGRQFDATELLGGDAKPNSDEEAAKPVTPLSVSMSVDRLITGKNKSIEKIRLFMLRNNWSRIEQLEVNGISGNQPLILRYTPAPKGHTLKFEADNAGAALSALGITDGMRGGKLAVNGQPDPNGGKRGLRGTVAVTNFALVNVPVLGRLLNALSLPGIIELLNGKGVAFKKMRADFWWIDKGQPENVKNTRIIRLKDGQTSGSSLGLTFEGVIDQWKNMLDISGTIIPVSDLNKLLSFIPLVGNILTAGGEGVFAATYTIKGPKDQSTVTVNPLAVLAPGILRKLFFEK